MSEEKPIREIKCGSVRAAIWRTGNEDGHGAFRVRFSCRFKEYGTWRNATSFGPDEIPLLGRAAEMALAWIYSQPKGESSDTIYE